MRAKVIDINFYSDKDWVLKLKQSDGIECFAMTKDIYDKLGIENPISKKVLDSVDIGSSFLIETISNGNRNLVIKLK